MLIAATHLKDFAIHATDGEIGSIEEFYFDDEKWTIRYLVVNTGSWLLGRSVLISPVFLTGLDWANKRLDFSLTKQQIENSPGIDTHRPVSRQHEAEYMTYYGYPYYWGGSDVWGGGPFPAGMVGPLIPLETQALRDKQNLADSHLRSTAAVTGYHVAATNGEIGHVHGFILDADTWTIRYLEVSTSNWWSGKRVLMSPEWIEAVSWLDSNVTVNLLRETIQTAPEYLESAAITHNYEVELHQHYDKAFKPAT